MESRDGDDVQSPDGGQEVASTYGRDRGKSVLHWHECYYKRYCRTENHYTCETLTLGAQSTNQIVISGAGAAEGSLCSQSHMPVFCFGLYATIVTTKKE